MIVCSFCGASGHDVPRMVASDRAAICSRCVIECVDILIADGDAKTNVEPTIDLTPSGQAAAEALIGSEERADA